MKKCLCIVHLSQQEANDITQRALGERTPVREDRFGEAVSNALFEGSMARTDCHGPRAKSSGPNKRDAARRVSTQKFYRKIARANLVEDQHCRCDHRGPEAAFVAHG